MATRRVANFADLQRLKIFLEEQRLTVEGVDDWIRNFLTMEDQSGNWIGVAGYELYSESYLLRSVGVGREFRRKGFGKQIVDRVLRNTMSKGALSSYLLTGNAVDFLSKTGFDTIKREVEE